MGTLGEAEGERVRERSLASSPPTGGRPALGLCPLEALPLSALPSGEALPLSPPPLSGTRLQRLDRGDTPLLGRVEPGVVGSLLVASADVRPVAVETLPERLPLLLVLRGTTPRGLFDRRGLSSSRLPRDADRCHMVEA